MVWMMLWSLGLLPITLHYILYPFLYPFVSHAKAVAAAAQAAPESAPQAAQDQAAPDAAGTLPDGTPNTAGVSCRCAAMSPRGWMP